MGEVLEEVAGGEQGAGGAAVAPGGVAMALPVVGFGGLEEEGAEGIGVFLEPAGAASLDEFDIAFFLAGNDFDNQAGSSGGGGFVSGGSAGFGDHEVVSGHEAWDIVDPAEKLQPTRIGLGEFAGGGSEAIGVSGEDGRDLETWGTAVEEGMEGTAEGWDGAGGKVEESARRVGGGGRRQVGEAGRDGESSVNHDGARLSPGTEVLSGNLIGGEIGSDRRTPPDRVDGDGIGNDSENGDRGTAEQPVEEVRVKWEGAGDDGGWIAAQIFRECGTHGAEGLHGVAFERQSAGASIELTPCPRRMRDGGGVNFTQKRSKDRLGLADKIADFHTHGIARFAPDCFSQAPSRTVVTVPERGGEEQNAGRRHGRHGSRRSRDAR